MSGISTLTGLTSTILNQSSALPPAKQPENPDNQTNANGTESVYGPAYVLSISDAGQAHIDNDTSVTSAAAAAPASAGAAAAAPSQASSTTDSGDSPSSGSGSSPPTGSAGGSGASLESSLEEASKQKVRPQVGPTGADEVVDKQGNINETKLKALLAQQEQQAHRFDVKPTTQS